MDVELNVRIGNAATAMARIVKRAWDNTMLTLNTKNEGVPSLRVKHSHEEWRVEFLSHAQPGAQPQEILGYHLAEPSHKRKLLVPDRRS